MKEAHSIGVKTLCKTPMPRMNRKARLAKSKEKLLKKILEFPERDWKTKKKGSRRGTIRQ
jgi:hypothetical protein